MEEKLKYPEETVDIAPFDYAISIISGKWKMHILFWLWKEETMRYSEIKRVLGKVTHKMLSNTLKELAADGLIVRHEYPQVPPKVEYSLSEKGYTILPVIRSICQWGHLQFPDKEGTESHKSHT